MAFAKQQGEIAALDRAQEKAEARVSSIHHQLTASESELSVLEGEMAEVSAQSWALVPTSLPTPNVRVARACGLARSIPWQNHTAFARPYEENGVM